MKLVRTKNINRLMHPFKNDSVKRVIALCGAVVTIFNASITLSGCSKSNDQTDTAITSYVKKDEYSKEELSIISVSLDGVEEKAYHIVTKTNNHLTEDVEYAKEALNYMGSLNDYDIRSCTALLSSYNYVLYDNERYVTGIMIANISDDPDECLYYGTKLLISDIAKTTIITVSSYIKDEKTGRISDVRSKTYLIDNSKNELMDASEGEIVSINIVSFDDVSELSRRSTYSYRELEELETSLLVTSLKSNKDTLEEKGFKGV